jgi:hypothetical protein
MTYVKHILDGVLSHYSDDKDNCIPHALGNTDYARMTQEVADGLAEIIEVDDTPVPTVDEARQSEYDVAGATDETMTVMLWEIMVEGRTPDEVGATALQVKRLKVKSDNPK